jgi:hypothetical protein
MGTRRGMPSAQYVLRGWESHEVSFVGSRYDALRDNAAAAANDGKDDYYEATAMPKSKAESYKEVIMSSVEEETEDEAIADAAKAAAQIYVGRAVRPEELSRLVEKTLDAGGESFRLKFDDGSSLYLSTNGGILTATVSK